MADSELYNENLLSTRFLVRSALLIALLAISAQITLSFGPVPFTLQIAVVGLITCTCTPREALATVGGYIVLGGIGLPIFSAARGGLAMIAGPTGGFILSFALGAAAGAWIRLMILHKVDVDRRRSVIIADGVGLLTLMVINYALGTIQFMYVMHMGLGQSLALCVLPFILFDVAKCAVAVIVAESLRRAMGTDARWGISVAGK